MEIVGRLTANAIVRTVKNTDRKVVSFAVAVNDRYNTKDGDLKSLTSFFNCDYWVNPGIAEYLTKGMLVELNGRVSTSAWLNVEGEAKSSLNIHVNSIKLHGKSHSGGSVSAETPPVVAKPAEDLPF